MSAPTPPTLPRTLAGCTPGLLDPTQPNRLHRIPGSFLHFASFHPRTANPQHDVHGHVVFADDDSCQPRRVVIETAPDGKSTWRFVPNARHEHGLQHDEGPWPRMINICGQLVICSLDQWDIYKLDPAYDCFVPAPPATPIITAIPSRPPPSSSSSRLASPPPSSAISTPQSASKTDTRDRSTTPPRNQKRPRGRPFPRNLSDIEDYDDDLASDEDLGMELDDRRPINGRAQRSRADMEEKRKLRRDKLARAEEKRRTRSQQQVVDSQPSSTSFDFSAGPSVHMQSPGPSMKRKETYHPDAPTREPRSEIIYVPRAASGHKRARTVSPDSIRRELASQKSERRSRLNESRQKVLTAKRAAQEKAFMDSILADLPNPTTTSVLDTDSESGEQGRKGSEAYSGTDLHDIDENDDEENEEGAEAVAHRTALEESRRKMAELEADRPLWEQAARARERREAAERAEEVSRKRAKLRAEAARLVAEAEEVARVQARSALAEQEAAQRRHSRRRERVAAAQQHFMRPGPWTPQRALERYNVLADAFDAAKFTSDDPLLFELVPWPVLHAPGGFKIEDVGWDAVEAFFRAVRPLMSSRIVGIAGGYKTFVQRAQRRFHPDRWSARRVLNTIPDESERDFMMSALNTVSQAITSVSNELRNA